MYQMTKFNAKAAIQMLFVLLCSSLFIPLQAHDAMAVYVHHLAEQIAKGLFTYHSNQVSEDLAPYQPYFSEKLWQDIDRQTIHESDNSQHSVMVFAEQSGNDQVNITKHEANWTDFHVYIPLLVSYNGYDTQQYQSVITEMTLRAYHQLDEKLNYTVKVLSYQPRVTMQTPIERKSLSRLKTCRAGIKLDED